MKFRERYLISLFGIIMTLACTRDDVQVEVITQQAIHYDAMCQRDTIRFSSNKDWTVDSDCEWCTVENDSGTGNGAISLYIQQNDGGCERDGHIVVRFAGNKEVEFTIKALVENISSDKIKKAVVIHTHPNGDVTPSGADFATTDRIYSVCTVMGVELVDHIILNEKTFFSFKSK